MSIESILFSEFLSHPDKLYIEHITNMFDSDDTLLEREVKRFHDIAKLKNNFQKYIRGDKGVDKNHSLLSAYLFLLNSDFETRDLLFGFLAIASHHGNIENFFTLGEDNRYIGKYSTNSKELEFLDEVISNANSLGFYDKIEGEISILESKNKQYQRYLRSFKFRNSFDYRDFIDFKKLYASLIYSDKYEAIFGVGKESQKTIDKSVLTNYIDSLPYHQKRDKFRKFVLSNFDNSHKLFTLTAPTGYGKTLTALEFALKFQKEKIIFALPFTSIIDQTQKV
ncbi:MAG: CRISPR-associated endonuclease Cas3'', partial [Sulfurovaceae bacterium]|nr:CRISPR-associated endonuclease Cas3'' [Sulfurovaceae bacterium]